MFPAMTERDSRRAFLSIAGAAAVLAACRKDEHDGSQSTAVTTTASSSAPKSEDEPKKDEDEPEVTATEDLMREHGVIRRVLVVYRESASRLQAKPASVPPDALARAAKLIRSFAEDYHEKQLEEANIFPALMKSGGPLASTVSTLIAQHQRGREVTDYVLAVTQKTIGAASAEPLARALEGFARMYEEHAAMEDTIVFPAWKKTLSPKDLDAIGDKFEDIEHKTFGKDGFDDAVDQIGAIEKSLGIELGAFTPPPPPR
jgi:hemerythrin-like domain-containing protein